MNSQTTQLDTAVEPHSTHSRAFFRGFVDGTTGLFDILGIRARPRKHRTPEDDTRNLHRDVQRVGEDFRAVLSRIAIAFKK